MFCAAAKGEKIAVRRGGLREDGHDQGGDRQGDHRRDRLLRRRLHRRHRRDARPDGRRTRSAPARSRAPARSSARSATTTSTTATWSPTSASRAWSPRRRRGRMYMRRRLSPSPSCSGLRGVAAARGFASLAGSGCRRRKPEYGPPKGTLVIVGGGNLNGSGINEKFIELAGGPEKNFVIVPTAGGNRERAGRAHRLRRAADHRAVGAARPQERAACCTPHDPKVADTEEFAKVLRDADAVWFNGGRQWNIVDSYANTLTYREFHKVLERGGVIGGSSAGATIQGEYLVRGDTSGSDVMMTRRAEPPGGLQVPAPRRHRSAHQHAQPLGPPHPGHPEVSRSCSASACRRPRRSSSRATASR